MRAGKPAVLVTESRYPGEVVRALPDPGEKGWALDSLLMDTIGWEEGGQSYSQRTDQEMGGVLISP